jgi:hypothetical protein
MAVVAGETYRIGVSGFFGSIGYFALRLARPPVNDDFADARDVSGPLPIVLTDTNFDAASEPGEARHAGNAARTSVWFRWTAPTTGPAVIDTCGSDFDTRLGVYTGTSVDALAEIAAGDDDCGQAGRATFDAVSGTTYRIAVDGFLAAGGRDTGSIAMRIDQPPLPPAAPAMSLTQTTPASPANDTGPRVTGTAPDGAEIRLYRNDATCTGLPAATGTAFELAGSGIAVEVPDDSSTAIRATATVDGRTSACSEPLEYVEDSTVPATPTLLGTFVLKDRPPLVMGLADAGTTVRLYVNNATCAGQPAAVGSAAEFAGPGLAVPLKGAARIRATAADPGGSSGCSSVLAYSGPSASCAGLPATLVGTEHDDLIRGTPRRDIVAGLGGNDELRGLRGHDILCGGPGDDLLLGGRGVDEFHGGSGKDTPRQERT